MEEGKKEQKTMTIRSFSGAHPFRPECLIEAYQNCMRYERPDPEDSRFDAEEFTMSRLPSIDAGRCARCDSLFGDGEFPAGSRETVCRSIPICSVCGRAEALWPLAEMRIKGPEDAPLDALLSAVCDWPVSRSEQEVALEVLDRDSTVLGGFVTTGSEGDPVMVTEEGVAQLHLREHPGGGLEYGYDDRQDRAERGR